MDDSVDHPAQSSPGSYRVWRDRDPVGPHDTDLHGRLAIPALVRRLQAAAVAHATALGVGFDEMSAAGLAWMLHRLRVVISSRPPIGRGVVVETWPSGRGPLRAFREFRVHDDASRPVAHASSIWIVLDVARRRATKVPAFVASIGTGPGIEGFAWGERPAGVAASVSPALSVPVLRSDLDVNGHVNHVRLVSWLLDAVPDAFDEAGLVELDVLFVAERGAGGRVDVRVVDDETAEPASDGRRFEHALHGDDGRELVRAATVWRH